MPRTRLFTDDDEQYTYKANEIANHAYTLLDNFVTPFIKDGYSIRDLHYIITHAIDDIIITHHLENRA